MLEVQLEDNHERKITRILLVIAFLSATVIGTAPTTVFAQAGDGNRVEGSWYITVTVTEPIQATFDATYAFAKGGVFTRIDGRNNAPAVGTWKYTDQDAVPRIPTPALRAPFSTANCRISGRFHGFGFLRGVVNRNVDV